MTDIDCPGDTISYNCTIETNSEIPPHLTWNVTVPGFTPLSVTYNENSTLDIINDLGMNISTILVVANDGYIKSVILLTITKYVNLNGTVVECSIGPNLRSEAVTLYVDSSGKFYDIHNNYVLQDT